MNDDHLPRYIEKPWGSETIFACNEHYIGKVLSVRKGQQLSLQYHKQKHETMFLNTGVGIITIDDRVLKMNPGEQHVIPPGVRHRFHALDDCVIFEVSTSHLNDVVRLEDDYGRVDE